MAEHTKGPWTYEPKARMKHDQSAPVRGPSGMYVATALDMNRYDKDEEVEANAALIAAAPDLLAACEAAYSLLTEYGASAAVGRGIDLRDELRSAIAKARSTA